MFILSETNLKKLGSFIYELHNNAFFDKGKLEFLLKECRILSDLYDKNGKTTQYVSVLKGIVSTFQHILFLISCHFMSDDIFVINNYDVDLSSEIVSDYYTEFRVILSNLII